MGGNKTMEEKIIKILSIIGYTCGTIGFIGFTYVVIKLGFF